MTQWYCGVDSRGACAWWVHVWALQLLLGLSGGVAARPVDVLLTESTGASPRTHPAAPSTLFVGTVARAVGPTVVREAQCRCFTQVQLLRCQQLNTRTRQALVSSIHTRCRSMLADIRQHGCTTPDVAPAIMLICTRVGLHVSIASIWRHQVKLVMCTSQWASPGRQDNMCIESRQQTHATSCSYLGTNRSKNMACTTMMQQRALTGGTTARCSTTRVLLPCRPAPTNRMNGGSGRGLQQLVRAQTQSGKGEPHAGSRQQPLTATQQRAPPAAATDPAMHPAATDQPKITREAEPEE